VNARLQHIDILKENIITVWLATILVLVVGGFFIKDIIVFILTKLYEILIQRNIFKV
jgi:hypothetical protein